MHRAAAKCTASAVGGTSLVWGARGNLATDGAFVATGYDNNNRLTGVAPNVVLSYDPQSRMRRVSAGTTTTRFLYDGADVIGEANASGTMIRRYVHGPGVDEPIVWYEGSGTSDRRHLLADERGSIVAVTDAAGAGSVTVNRYDPFGLPAAGNLGRFQYTGQMWLAEAGLYHYKARAYTPRLGRFLQPDPIGMAGGMNLYAYAGGDPVNGTDPWGLQECYNGANGRSFDGSEPLCETEIITVFGQRCDSTC